jgi:YidC/Oxa1 family membrane protein insertase
MDRTAIVAIALSLLFLVFYPTLLKWTGLNRYTQAQRAPAPAAVDTTARIATPSSPSPAPGAPAASREGPPTLASHPFSTQEAGIERSYEIETPLYVAQFSSAGARLVSMELKRYASAHGISSRGPERRHFAAGHEVPPGDRVVMAGGPLVSLALGAESGTQPLDRTTFAVVESTDASGATRAITFTRRDSTGAVLVVTYRTRPDDYALELSTRIESVPVEWRVTDYSIVTRSWPQTTETDYESDLRQLRASSRVGTTVRREHAPNLLKQPKRFDGNAAWAAVQTRYFLTGVAVIAGTARGVVSSADKVSLTGSEADALPPGIPREQNVVVNALVMSLPAQGQEHRFLLYAGPSEYSRLTRLGVGFEQAVDLGWNWVLPFSRMLLQLLNWIHGVVRNYGLAILALATLVRLALHPLNVSSMRSMRAMQKIQPEIQRIREKYKKDPQTMNTAMMALYKENKVNPAGGCLPLVLQMPLFLALYQVLFNAIELRQAPFVAWMNDLSAPDVLFHVANFPIRLLPILMLGSGLLQQMLTPSAPEQRPTMYMMNVVMLVFFYNLPSGLVLYWTVMNVLTALQQWIVLRQDGPMPVVVREGTAKSKPERSPAGRSR